MSYSAIYKHTLALIFSLLMFSCKQEQNLYRIEAERMEINDSIQSRADIEEFIKPYREHVNSNLDSVLAYAPFTYSKADGRFNTAIGNLMADLVYEQSNPIFKQRTGQNLDMVLLNHGGIRAIISEGHITTRTAYEVMPFENSIVVARLKGDVIMELIEYLRNAQRAHPISGLKLALGENNQLLSAEINGEVIDTTRLYNVATSDYLYYGGDRMNFYRKSDTMMVLDYKIRNAMIDYFKKVDTIKAVIDNRFTTLKPEEE